VCVMEGKRRMIAAEAPPRKRTRPRSAAEMHAAEMSTAAEMRATEVHTAAVPAAAEMSPKIRLAAKVSTAMGTGVGSRRQHRRQTDDSNSEVEFPHELPPVRNIVEARRHGPMDCNAKGKSVVPNAPLTMDCLPQELVKSSPAIHKLLIDVWRSIHPLTATHRSTVIAPVRTAPAAIFSELIAALASVSSIIEHPPVWGVVLAS